VAISRLKMNSNKKYIAKVYNVTLWDRKPWATTMGTRKKMVCEEPGGGCYFFKESYKNYPWEFWSEVIASKVGQFLEVRVANYDVAYYKNPEEGYIAGCISKYVHERESEALIHGIDILLEEKPEFDKKKGKDHSFQLIEKVLNNFPPFKPYVENIIEAIVFDALIGNRDRHQENWAIILEVGKLRRFSKYPKFISLPLLIIRIALWVLQNYIFKGRTTPLLGYRFSPLYDNGSSLGREIAENKIDEYIYNVDHDQKLRKYSLGKKYQSHIRWNDQHLGHFDLIRKIRTIHPNWVNRYLSKFVNNYNHDRITEIINHIDDDFKPKNKDYCLTSKRKELILALFHIRYSELKQLLNEL